MILFYINYQDNDDDMGLFLSASTRAEAIHLWQKWAMNSFSLRVTPWPKNVFLVPRVGDVPTQHVWHAKSGVLCVLEAGIDELEVIALAINYGITSYKQLPEGVTDETITP